MTTFEVLVLVGFGFVVWGLVGTNSQLAKTRSVLVDINTKIDGLGSPAQDDDVSAAAGRIVMAIKEMK